MDQGKVYLVGAGTGHPGYITLRGVDCLGQADVVLYDYLVNPILVRHAPPAAERICLGQHGRTRIWTQQEVNEKMVALALAGKRVVRLKGGDSALFARLSEEVAALREHQIEYEVVPGITAALAAGACAGVPLTDRDRASAVAIVTGQQRADRTNDSFDWPALAQFPGTLVIYMGVTTAPQWTAALLAAGKSPDTPAAIVRRCGLPDQVKINTTLGQVTEYLGPGSRIRPPAIVILGEVVQVDGGSWFEQRPLFGQSIIVTRPTGQSEELSDQLSGLGARVLQQPAIEIVPPDDWSTVDAAIDQQGEFDWLVFSSSNGVRHWFDRLWQRGKDLRSLGNCRIAAIGPGTSATLNDYQVQVDLQPSPYRAEALADALSPEASGKRFLLVRANRGRQVLAERLTAAGGKVEQVVAYQSCDIQEADPMVAEQMEHAAGDWVTVTSSAIARSLVALFGDQLQHARLASISPITSATLRELGYSPTVEATTYTSQGLVKAILAATRQENS